MKNPCFFKKTFTVILALSLSLSVFNRVAAQELNISAKSAVIIEKYSREIIYEKSAKEKMPMASTTKIMTAIIALEYAKGDDIVTIPLEATKEEGSSLYLKTGEQLLMKDLITGLMLNSGNDAATAIAMHIAGSTSEFAYIMSEKAKAIGANSTNFTNANGLPDDNHYTTAYDLAIITAYGLSNPLFAKISATQSDTIETIANNNFEKRNIYLKNHNKLLNMQKYAIGVKTGFTKAAGRCLVGAGKKDGVELVSVTLNAPDDWNDHQEMLEYGFSKVENRQIIAKGDLYTKLYVENGERENLSAIFEHAIIVPFVNGKEPKFNIRYIGKSSVTAPVYDGDILGECIIFLAGKKIGNVNMIAAESVNALPKPTFSTVFEKIISNWLLPIQ